MTTPSTLKQVNLAIAKAGMKEIELFKGNGYFYFMGIQCDERKGGVYVNSLRQLTLEQWVEEARERYIEENS